MTDTNTIVDAIDARIAAAHEQIAALTEARRSLISTNGAAARPPAEPKPARAAKPRRAPATPRRAKPRPVAIVPAGKLEVLLASTGEDLSTAALARLAGGQGSQVLTLLRVLEQAGKVRRIGERRSTRWHWITDEDRIAARTAELEAIAKARR